MFPIPKKRKYKKRTNELEVIKPRLVFSKTAEKVKRSATNNTAKNKEVAEKELGSTK